MEIDKVKELIYLMKEHNLKILRLEEGGTEIYLESHPEEGSAKPGQTNVEGVHTTERDTSTAAKANSGLIEVRANQIGIFYTQPDEDSTDTFVSVGDKVKVGDQIGLIEIMKLFNEVRVEQSGIVEEILVANGEPVEYDQVLMLLRPEEE